MNLAILGKKKIIFQNVIFFTFYSNGPIISFVGTKKIY